MHSNKPGVSTAQGADYGHRGLMARLRELMPHRLAPERISRFENMGAIGSGCMGRVFKAFDTRLGIDVALKIASRHERAKISIENEVRALSDIRHGNIVRLLDSGIFSDGQYGGMPFLVMGLVFGDSLKGILDREGTLEWGHAKHMLMELCDALSASHEAGFVHRDVKPENILIGRDGLTLVDFGVSEPILSRYSIRNLTVSRFSPGNIGFAAPETFFGKSDQRTDIYSAGMLMRRMRVGSLPQDPSFMFSGTMPAEADAVLAEARLSEAEMMIIARATDRCPEKRYESASQMRAAIYCA
jgi:serine/threonine-protein kinase